MAWTEAWRGLRNNVDTGAFVFNIPKARFSPIIHDLDILFRGKKKCYDVM